MRNRLISEFATVAGGFVAAGLLSLATGPVVHADAGDLSPGLDPDFMVGPLQNFGFFFDQSFADPDDNEFVATVISNHFFTDVLTSGADPANNLAAFGIPDDIGVGVAGETVNTFIVPSDPALDFTFSLPFADPFAELFTQLLPFGF